MGKSYYIVNKLPVFLTFKNYTSIISECEANGMLDTHRPMTFADDKASQEKEYQAICSYLLKIRNTNSDMYDHIKNFSCYGEEAKENLYRLLDSFGYYYTNRNFPIFSRPFFGFESANSKNQFFQNDLRFPMGKRYYFCYTFKNEAFGIKVLIDTDEVDSLHGNMESFIVFFKTGMVLKGDRGNVCIYYNT